MFNWSDIMVAEERARDRERHLEQERLARQIPAQPGFRERASRWLLQHLGQWLEGWGQRLQARAQPRPPIIHQPLRARR